MDTQNESLEEKLNSHIDALATKILLHVVSNVVLSSIMPYSSAREIWTKLQDKYSKSNIFEDDCVASTSGRDEFSSYTTSPTCDFSQGNDMVSGDRNCNMDSVFTTCNPSYLSICYDLSLDLNTSRTQNSLHACVNSPCISCRNDLNKSHDDMLMLSCCHDKNASISSSACVANHIEENEDSMGQVKVLKRDTSAISSSPSYGSHMCLMAKGTKVTSLDPIISHDDDDEVENDNDDYRSKYDITSIKKMGEVVYSALYKNKIASSNLLEILNYAIEGNDLIEEQEDIIDEKFALEREYANE